METTEIKSVGSVRGRTESNTPIIFWLTILAFLVYAMILIGGITRLTNSGLSIVDWQPIMGVIPPMGEEEWNEVFEKYKQFPEYQIVNQRMSLSEFKRIYFWEYTHRLIARLVAFVFLIPWVIFLIKRRIPAKLNVKLIILFFLGAAQGLLGWYMVKSGLIEMPHVSHYRLAAHLTLALTLLGATVWQIQNLRHNDSTTMSFAHSSMRILALAFAALLSLQIFYGAMVAGLDAGIGYNTFPKMVGEWIPPFMFALKPLWINVFENKTTVQFIHRTLGWITLFGAVGLWLYSRKVLLNKRQQLAVYGIVGMVAVQFVLGILTLIYFVPVGLGVAHQAVAALLLVLAVNANHSLKGSPSPI